MDKHADTTPDELEGIPTEATAHECLAWRKKHLTVVKERFLKKAQDHHTGPLQR